MIEISRSLSIPEDEVTFRAARSGGPGGQHVNKVNTRVILLFDVDGSPTLDSRQKRRIRQRLATRISKEGVLRVTCGRHRSRSSNRKEAVERFAGLLRHALRRKPVRRKTAVPTGQRRRRMEQKKRRGDVKKRRGRVSGED